MGLQPRMCGGEVECSRQTEGPNAPAAPWPPPPVACDKLGAGRCRPALHQDRTVGNIHVKQVHLQVCGVCGCMVFV